MKKNQSREAATPAASLAATTLPAHDGFNDVARVYIAISLLTILATTLLLYILNYLVVSVYHPDSANMLAHIMPMTVMPPADFVPEPVERLQFQLSLLFTPVFALGTYTLFCKLKDSLQANAAMAAAINIGSVILFLLFFLHLLNEKIIYMPDSTNATLFEKNLAVKIDPVIAIIIYLVITYLLVIYFKSAISGTKNITSKIVSGICYLVAAVTIYDVFLCNLFSLPAQSGATIFETNPVLYPVTQVYVGKSLLVDFNAQYGLYPLLLLPVFKIIGLSTYKFGIVMAGLNAASFVFLYLGIKKIIRQDVVALLVYLAAIYWLYWNVRLPLEGTTRYYYQYAPIRTIFPTLVFYLFVCYQQSTTSMQRILLPLLAACASLAVLWNTDTGAPVFGATLIALLYSQTGPGTINNWIKKSIKPFAWMVGSFLVVFALLVLVTKMRSGSWPNFTQFLFFQQLFYGSGYNMLPMTALHFWNLPALVYIAACTFCVYYLRKTKTAEANVSAFLFILGCGLFVYFQGRSYDTTIFFVMYPAIICAGIFCKKLLNRIQSSGIYTLKLHEVVALFAIPFLFITDAAFSMLAYTPTIHSFGSENAYANGGKTMADLANRAKYLETVVPPHDTVIILSMNCEAFMYAGGHYYNPVNVASSTEIFVKSDFNLLVDALKTTKYPIFFDPNSPMAFDRSLNFHSLDTIVEALAKNTHIEKYGPDGSMLLKHGRTYTDKLQPDANTMLYYDYGEMGKWLAQGTIKLTLPESFTVEMLISQGANKNAKNLPVMGNVGKGTNFSGMAVIQVSAQTGQYGIIFGNGTAWMTGASFLMDTAQVNDVVFAVNKNVVTTTLNGKPVSTVALAAPIKNCDELFYFNSGFSGTVYELKIEKM